jgi:hypothetical protein
MSGYGTVADALTLRLSAGRMVHSRCLTIRVEIQQQSQQVVQHFQAAEAHICVTPTSRHGVQESRQKSLQQHPGECIDSLQLLDDSPRHTFTHLCPHRQSALYEVKGKLLHQLSPVQVDDFGLLHDRLEHPQQAFLDKETPARS